VKTTTVVLLAAGFAAASTGAWSAELSDQDRAELRQRAQEFHNQRARNPDFQPGQGRLAPEQAETSDRRSKRAGKAQASATTTKEPPR